MDQPHRPEDNVGIPDDLRCKRTDGKHWRCKELSMPDNTLCEKHYIKRKVNDSESDDSEYEDSGRSNRTLPTTEEVCPLSSITIYPETSFYETGGLPCHQCRSIVGGDLMVWCVKCDKRGYCKNCILTWYSDIPIAEIQRVCPVCRGTCSCRVCLQGDTLKARIRELPAKDKLEYLCGLLSAVLPMIKKIHSEQCSEVELENRLSGGKIVIARNKINLDEQMYCDFCRIPIIDYHRHCTNCSYDLCLGCCKDIREASKPSDKGEMNQTPGRTGYEGKTMVSKCMKLSQVQLNSFEKFADWKVISGESIQCPPKEYGGCSSGLLSLERIFKRNWVAKLVKNAEEMVNGCEICSPEKTGFDLRLFQAAHRENDDDNFLYYPSSHDVKNEGIRDFRMHWSKGKPVIVKEVCDASSVTIWDPTVIWKGIKETTEEKMGDAIRFVKAVNCSDWTEINIELEEFLKGYLDGRFHENGQQQLLKLKDWPSSSASEKFLLYQRHNFISKLPLFEFIHSKWGHLNVAAKLPHYSLQSDVGPKIFISYGAVEELGQGDSTNNLHLDMRDMVYLMVHMCEVNSKDVHRTKIDALAQSDTKELSGDPEFHSSRGGLPKLTPGSEANVHSDDHDKVDDHGIAGSFFAEENRAGCKILEKARAGALWDVFRRQDIPKLREYIIIHWKDIGKADSIINQHPLYEGVVYLNKHHKSKLREEFGVEPWSFEQHIGEAVFIPAGCPFQVRHLQSSVQLGLDFLSPESLSEAARLFEEIRGLPNDHEAKLHILQVGKLSLYAASSIVKQVEELVLDPILGAELGFEDPNLTALVSQNIVKQRALFKGGYSGFRI
ncbi:hypothetical protein ACJIZ3_013183 [Penstemon smallii]|uniref:Lysine-specific demethylase JMJ25 n=1 Tax=Penstemon smallii TaxID=265156 RepID=A0ABD3UP51_9LAMI